MRSSVPSLNDQLHDAIVGWESAWNVPGLSGLTRITFSPRLQRALGRCVPSTGRVTLTTRLRRGSRDRLLETLCHEVAHVAAYMLHGNTTRPHGPEWAALFRAAGFDPGTHARRRRGTPKALNRPVRDKPPRFTVVHSCPVCHSRRYARRRMSTWRCRSCVDAGLSGELTAARVDA
jgi:predicted SprT family Zn-dependent metalloprotease